MCYNITSEVVKKYLANTVADPRWRKYHKNIQIHWRRASMSAETILNHYVYEPLKWN